MSDQIKIIAIDGPAGAGKSTIAKGVARKLNVSYLDTGAMYRAVTLKALQQGVNMEDEDELVDIAASAKVELKGDANRLCVLLDGKDVSNDIRSNDVTNNTRYIANSAKVREIVTEWQREVGRRESVVMEGRDIGSVVFPDANYKFYLDADVSERARRRIEELKEKGEEVDERKITEDIEKRDQNDMQRKVSPLIKAEDAIVIDSTKKTIEDSVEEILKYIK